MNFYLASLVATSALVGISSYLSISETNESILRTVLSLMVICTVITPIVTMIGEVEMLDVGGYDIEEFISSIDESEFGKSAKEAFECGVEKFVCERFSLKDSDVKVVAFGFDTLNMKAEKIKVIVYGEGACADLRGIAYEINDSGLGICEVEIGVR